MDGRGGTPPGGPRRRNHPRSAARAAPAAAQAGTGACDEGPPSILHGFHLLPATTPLSPCTYFRIRQMVSTMDNPKVQVLIMFDVLRMCRDVGDEVHPGGTSAVVAVGADLERPAAGGSPVAATAAGNVLDPSGGAAEQVLPERTAYPKKRKPKGGVNLRKSLAWDSAFFTGEGDRCNGL